MQRSTRHSATTLYIFTSKPSRPHSRPADLLCASFLLPFALSLRTPVPRRAVSPNPAAPDLEDGRTCHSEVPDWATLHTILFLILDSTADSVHVGSSAAVIIVCWPTS